MPEVTDERGNIVTFILRPSSTGRKGFVEILFSAKPDEVFRNELKAPGVDFGYSRYRDGVRDTGGVWYGREDKLPARYKHAPISEPPKPAETPTPLHGPDNLGPRCEDVAPQCSLCGGSGPLQQYGANTLMVCALCAADLADIKAIEQTRVPPNAPPTPPPGPSGEVSVPKGEIVPVEAQNAPQPPTPPGLQVRPAIGGWAVVHVGSNNPLDKAFVKPTEAEANSLMQQILFLADWNLSIAELHKLPGLKEKLVKALTGGKPTIEKGVPAISNGNTWAESEVPKVDFAARLRSLISKK
jgi:hypothetical protein